MKKLTLSLLAVTLMFLAPDWVKAERFEAIPAAITDTETGLMWLSRPCCIHGSWEESDAFTAGLDYAGYQDWRTPTVQELEALFEAIGNPSDFPTQTNHPLFDDMQRYYWTTNPYMVFNISDSTIFYDDVNPYWIWPVRTTFIPTTTDQPIAAGYYNGSGKVEGDSDLVAGSNRSPIHIFRDPRRRYGGCTCTGTLNGTRWCDNGNGTVTDLTTCLVWLKNASWGGQYGFWEKKMEWNNAHDRASQLKNGVGGLSDGSVEGDWHLPTKTELSGLVNGDEHVSTGNMRAFTGVQSSTYWSWSTYESYPDIVIYMSSAWCVRMDSGRVSFAFKSNSFYVWPVRSDN